MDEIQSFVELKEKLSRAAQLLLLKHHIKPGSKGWELRRALGRDYKKTLKLLDAELEKFGLTIKRVDEGKEGSDLYFITLKGRPALTDTRTFGWRIDDMSMLTIALAYILSKGGKAQLKDIERTLHEKFPKWRVEPTVDRFIRRGYLSEDDEGLLYVGWRTRAEVDQRTLLGLLLGKDKQPEKTNEHTIEKNHTDNDQAEHHPT